MVLKCECGLSFSSNFKLYRHKKNCEVKNGSFQCVESSCQFKAKYARELLDHLQKEHDKRSEEMVKEFQSYSEFIHWKREYENSSKTSFVKKTSRKASSGIIEYYYCNRSGNFVSQSKGKRALKSQGSRKIGSSCPARIMVTISNNSKVIAKVIKTHYGHENSLAHIPIPKEEKKEIATQLSLGVSPARVLSNLYSEDISEVKRRHLITRQDILNISKTYGLDTVQKHSSDQISTDAYVEESLQSNKDLLLYKRQGEDTLYFPKDEPCTLQKEDFALAIMTDFQKRMLEQFGSNIICMDRTTCYGFYLITLLVIDEFQEGVPVAWLISNRENQVMLSLFLKQIKNRVEISSAYFMSDKVPQYYNTFRMIFSCEPRKLLCHWHVHKDWVKNMSKVKGKKQASIIYKSLCMLMEESNEDKFEKHLVTFYESLMEDSSTQDFGKYLKNEWMQNKKEWAKCFRIHSGITCNMFVESFHTRFKHNESNMKVKEGNQVDKCLNNLLSYSQDCARKRLVKLEKGKPTWKTTQINKRHQVALGVKNVSIKKTSDSTWELKSESSGNTFYIVEKYPLCNQNCGLKCKDCNICLHNYSCSCPDGLTGTNICKHVHYIVLNSKDEVFSDGSSCSTNSCSIPANEEDTSEDFTSDVFKTNLKSSTINDGDLNNIRKDIKEKFLQTISLIERCSNKSSLIIARENLNNVILALTFDNDHIQDDNVLRAKETSPNKNWGTW